MVQGGTDRRGYRLGIIPRGFYDKGKGEPWVVSLNHLTLTPITAGQFLLDWPGLDEGTAASLLTRVILNRKANKFAFRHCSHQAAAHPDGSHCDGAVFWRTA
jgi:hypothetical protein